MELIVDLLKEFVSIDTTATEHKNFDLMAKTIKSRAEALGLKAEITYDPKGIPHVIITLPEAPKDAKKVIFLAHYDVVPAGENWDHDPFKPFVEMNRLYGRGSADDKSGIVAGLVGLYEVLEAEKEPTINPLLVVVGGEETGEAVEFLGTLTGDLAVILDTGPEALSIGASGIVRAYITVYGDQCHSAAPMSCKNAIYEAMKIVGFLKRLGKRTIKRVKSKFPATRDFKKLPARLSVTQIEAKVAENVIPGSCSIIVDRRTIPEEDIKNVAEKLRSEIIRFARRHKIDVDVEVKPLAPGWVTKNTNVIEAVRDVLESLLAKEVPVGVELGTTDGVWLIDRMPVVQFGALRKGTNVHGANEFVYLDDVVLVKDFVRKLVLELEL